MRKKIRTILLCLMLSLSMSSGVVIAASCPPHGNTTATTYATNHVTVEYYRIYTNEYTVDAYGNKTLKYYLMKRMYQTDETYHTCNKCGDLIWSEQSKRLIFDGPAY